MSDSSKNLLAAHLRAHAVRTGGPFTLRSGEVSDFYVDARQTSFDGNGAMLIGEVVTHLLPDDVVAVGGLTMGADPISVATAMLSTARGRPLRAFSVRKSAKEHGMGGRIVGPVSTGDRVAAIEDTSTTGGAFMDAIDAMRDEGLVVAASLCLIDRSGGAVEDRMERAGIPYTAVFGPKDLGIG